MTKSDSVSKIRNLTLWSGAIALEQLDGGMSNAAFKVTDKTGTYVARLGEDYPFHQVSRSREAMASRAAFACGLSPELVHAEKGVMVLRHLDAKTLAEPDVRENWKACVDLIKRGHENMASKITGEAAIFWVFQIIRDYAATLCAHDHPLSAQASQWLAFAGRMEDQQVPLPIIFGHHDLLAANFLDDGKRLWLIDWEYGAFGTAMFDLANLAAANSFHADLESEMLEYYFGKTPDMELARAFSAMKVASALREAMWGIVSGIYFILPSVDYEAYATTNLARYDVILDQHMTRFGR